MSLAMSTLLGAVSALVYLINGGTLFLISISMFVVVLILIYWANLGLNSSLTISILGMADENGNEQSSQQQVIDVTTAAAAGSSTLDSDDYVGGKGLSRANQVAPDNASP